MRDIFKTEVCGESAKEPSNTGKRMVVDTRIELVTPAMSMQCSTAELIDLNQFWNAQIGLCGVCVKSVFFEASCRHDPFDLIDDLAQVKGFGENFRSCRGL